ncbi:MAG TPA: heme-binding protein [Beijerinckiaceae bacterium]|nr:heme-binding protein [Beijerinckiaceae bacterium]
MPNYLLLALESALAVFGIRSIYEQPRYEVVASVGNVEIRRYAPRLGAEVSVVADIPEKGRNEAFRILADYIFGQNREGAEIPMTTPVATGAPAAARPRGREIAMTAPVETAGTPDGVIMRFFLPTTVTRDNAPVPNDARVKIVEVPEETIAALTFSGRGTEEALADNKRELLGALASSPWHAAEEPYALFYDPPFTLPFLRRNEVAVRVRRT